MTMPSSFSPVGCSTPDDPERPVPGRDAAPGPLPSSGRGLCPEHHFTPLPDEGP